MNDPQSPDIRIGDAEREEALRALGEHMSAGRLDIDEYGERSAQVSTAKTRGDLAALFVDLPEPRPTFSTPAPATTPAAPPARPAPADPVRRWEQRPLAQRIGGAVMGVSWILMIPLFLVTHVWWVFLLPLVLSVVLGSLWGKDWENDRREWQRAQRERRRHHRDDR
ncbi:DUF1707 SHOCT-like domain-containing protein [Gandjariella thermophila]|uniref:DUF1707 domain-containing protein n=1 Tax=Gandjariella thermophila TaxID=1931992 RepID=A0A4D4J9L7_9PSEU|nr:DUF1707 domain-containing protein [Gandjariella thermophila]GDY31368.1 hypothetical protein GTS_30010 [Gandjariella thermophila]